MVTRDEKLSRYNELLKQGLSPSEALQISDAEMGEGYTSEKSQSEPKVKVVDAETGAEQDYEDFKNQIKTKYAEAKEDLSETKEDILAAAGFRERAPLLKKVAGKILKSFKPKPLTKEQKEIREAYLQSQQRAKVTRARVEGYRSGYSGYSVARQPERVKVVRVMKPPRHMDLPEDDMGMSFGTFGDPVGYIPRGSEPVQYRMRERPLVRNVEARLPKTRIPSGGREPVNYNPVNHPGANHLVDMGYSSSPVNVGVRQVGTRIPKQKKVSVRFHGKKPKTATRKPKIETKVITEKMFWEF